MKKNNEPESIEIARLKKEIKRLENYLTSAKQRAEGMQRWISMHEDALFIANGCIDTCVRLADEEIKRIVASQDGHGGDFFEGAGGAVRTARRLIDDTLSRYTKRSTP